MKSFITNGDAPGFAITTSSLSTYQIERIRLLQSPWLDRLQDATGCVLIAPVKLIQRFFGGGAAQSIRNRGNRINVAGREIEGHLVSGRVVFDLQQITGSMTTAKVVAEAAVVETEAPIEAASCRRPRKPKLTLSGGAA